MFLWKSAYNTSYADMFVGQNTSSAFALSLYAAHLTKKQI